MISVAEGLSVGSNETSQSTNLYWKKKSLPGNIVKILHKFGFFNSIIIIKKCDYLLICRFVSFEHTLKLHDSIVLYQIARIANMPNTLQFTTCIHKIKVRF